MTTLPPDALENFATTSRDQQQKDDSASRDQQKSTLRDQQQTADFSSSEQKKTANSILSSDQQETADFNTSRDKQKTADSITSSRDSQLANDAKNNIITTTSAKSAPTTFVPIVDSSDELLPTETPAKVSSGAETNSVNVPNSKIKVASERNDEKSKDTDIERARLAVKAAKNAAASNTGRTVNLPILSVESALGIYQFH